MLGNIFLDNEMFIFFEIKFMSLYVLYRDLLLRLLVLKYKFFENYIYLYFRL